MKTAILILLAFGLSACASAWPKHYEFRARETKPQAQITADYEHCTLYSRTVRPALQIYEQSACMEKRGYDTVEVAR